MSKESKEPRGSKNQQTTDTLGEAYTYIVTPVFMVTTGDGSIHLANSSAAKICGHKADDLKGMKFHLFFLDKDQQRILDMIDAGNDLGVYSEFNLRFFRKSGREIVVNLVGRRIELEGKALIVFTLNDITELHKSHEQLEVKVQERTADLNESRNRIKTIINSSLQGFLTFDKTLTIESEFSVKAVEFLGQDLLGKNVVDVLGINRNMFESFTQLVFQNINWEVVKQFSTMEVKLKERILKVEFVPILEEKQVKRILCTLADITPIKVLEQKAEKVAREGRVLFKVLQSKPIFLNVINSLFEDSEIPDAQDKNLAKRYVHTVKGECGFFELQDIVDICEKYESSWAETYKPEEFYELLKAARAKMREFTDRYDKILKLSQSKEIQMNVSMTGIKRVLENAVQDKAGPRVFTALEEMVEQPMDEVLAWLSETWTMVAAKLGKKVSPIQWKTSEAIFSEPYKKLFSTFVHAVRNSADHGIEFPNERKALGKSESGTLTGMLNLEKSVYHLRLIDDGKGIKKEAVVAKAKKLGLAVPDSDDELYQLLFEDSFSTTEKATQVSGRGVGLSALRAEARALGGDARVSNVPTGGMELHVWFNKLPLTELLK